MKKKNLVAFSLGSKKFYFKNERVKKIYYSIAFLYCMFSFYFYYCLFYAIIKGWLCKLKTKIKKCKKTWQNL